MDLSSWSKQCSPCAPPLQPLFSEDVQAVSRERKSVTRKRKKRGLENAIIGDSATEDLEHSIRETESVIRERETEKACTKSNLSKWSLPIFSLITYLSIYFS